MNGSSNLPASMKPTNQLCPLCQAKTRIWMDKYSCINWSGCIHVSELVEIDGTLQIEFATPQENQ